MQVTCEVFASRAVVVSYTCFDSLPARREVQPLALLRYPPTSGAVLFHIAAPPVYFSTASTSASTSFAALLTRMRVFTYDPSASSAPAINFA
ncbi:hypothetical protein LFL96_16935 [Paraburkholderia sp. D15]|uniref:hypothetical protein n=1 Tax=Paraburkholderia sp. D15 TaxID=2880218 RepID=UPI002478C781|nr:hypothetical protein [Paraburkholderia sp. D15]WGS49426.1 hypothetical protein LFL96_16935 [Paraburkholderia sp. D15]